MSLANLFSFWLNIQICPGRDKKAFEKFCAGEQYCSFKNNYFEDIN